MDTKHVLQVALISLVAVAIAMRVDAIKKIVVPAA